MKKLLHIALLFSAVAALFASLPATDIFSTGSALSASWTVQFGTWAVGSGVARAGTNSTAANAFWNADTFANDQYAQVTLGTLSAGQSYAGLILRASGTAGSSNAYMFATDGTTGTDHSTITELTNNSESVLQGCTATFTSGDTVRFEVITSGANAALTVYKNGASVCAYTDTTTVKASGSPGITSYAASASGTNAAVDNFEAGNISSGAVRRRVIVVQ